MTEPAFHENPSGGFFREAVQVMSAPWLAGDQGYRITYSFIGVVFDALAEYLRLGVLQRFPGTCQSSALPFIGTDRKILRGYRETDAGYADRLIAAFPTWKLAGNAPTLLRQLAAYFAPNAPVIRYVVNGINAAGVRFADWWTIQNGTLSYFRKTPSNWDWDGRDGQIRFWIIIYRTENFTPWYWGDGHYWGGGQSWGFEENFTENFAADARKFIAQWKAAGSHAGPWPSFDGGIIVTPEGSGLFDPSGSGAGYPNGTWDVFANRAGIPTTFYLGGV